MNLGMARATLTDADPDGCAALIEEAHDEAKQALAELRDLVRGTASGRPRPTGGWTPRCPALAARSPRAGAASSVRVEAAAVADDRGGGVLRRRRGADQRGQARRGRPVAVEVTARPATGCASMVTDDGRGRRRSRRAAPACAACATGSARSTAALTVTSPPGGPTVAAVELPCAS